MPDGGISCGHLTVQLVESRDSGVVHHRTVATKPGTVAGVDQYRAGDVSRLGRHDVDVFFVRRKRSGEADPSGRGREHDRARCDISDDIDVAVREHGHLEGARIVRRNDGGRAR